MRKLLVVCVWLSGCSPNGNSVGDLSDFIKKYRDPLTTAIEEFEFGPKKWILHIHFRGNDFGMVAGSENQVNLSTVELQKKSHPFKTLELPQRAAALELKFGFRHPKILGQVRYRHSSAAKALDAIRSLYGCETPSENLQNTFLVVSGGSHGATFMNEFLGELQGTCHKKADFVIAGDAMAYPEPKPMREISHLPAGVMCLNFFQRNAFSVLMGTPLESCYNFQYTGFFASNHGYAEKSGFALITKIFEIMDR